MRITVTGASGLIGVRLLGALQGRGDELTVLSRTPAHARESLGAHGIHPARVIAWEPLERPPEAESIDGQDGIVHLAGEQVAQRWTAAAKRAISDSRQTGTRNLVSAIARSEHPPRVLVSASAIGYYGPRGDEPLDEEASPGRDFLSGVCVAWEREAQAATAYGLRVATLRTGVVLDREGGALERMLTPFRLGIGGPVAGGRQYMAWIALDDLIGLYLAGLDDERYSGPFNATAPEPVTNREFSHALGRALHRPAIMPVPGPAMRVMYGEMAQIVTTGARALPAKALVLGHRFRYEHIDDALTAALAS